jgi:hypothetical protein
MMLVLSVFERLSLICMRMCGATADDNRERSHTCGGQGHSRLQRDCGSETGRHWAQRTYGLQGRGPAQGYCYQEGIQTRGAHALTAVICLVVLESIPACAGHCEQDPFGMCTVHAVGMQPWH